MPACVCRHSIESNRSIDSASRAGRQAIMHASNPTRRLEACRSVDPTQPTSLVAGLTSPSRLPSRAPPLLLATKPDQPPNAGVEWRPAFGLLWVLAGFDEGAAMGGSPSRRRRLRSVMTAHHTHACAKIEECPPLRSQQEGPLLCCREDRGRHTPSYPPGAYAPQRWVAPVRSGRPVSVVGRGRGACESGD